MNAPLLSYPMQELEITEKMRQICGKKNPGAPGGAPRFHLHFSILFYTEKVTMKDTPFAVHLVSIRP